MEWQLRWLAWGWRMHFQDSSLMAGTFIWLTISCRFSQCWGLEVTVPSHLHLDSDRMFELPHIWWPGKSSTEKFSSELEHKPVSFQRSWRIREARFYVYLNMKECNFVQHLIFLKPGHLQQQLLSAPLQLPYDIDFRFLIIGKIEHFQVSFLDLNHLRTH